MLGVKDGLSFIGQAGFTELIMMKYANVQSLISATPVISFAIVFGSPYALSAVAGGIAAVTASLPIGTGMADGNLAMKQVSYDNATKGQHNTTPTLLMGDGVIDDGAMRVQSDNSGQQIITEHQDQMAVNYNANYVFTGQSSVGLSNAKSEMASLTKQVWNPAKLLAVHAGITEEQASGIIVKLKQAGIMLNDYQFIRS